MAKVSLKNVTKKFNGRTVVDNLNLEVEDGMFACLLGEPGAGKTTTLKMIAGLENPDAGEIYLDDVLINNVEPRHRDVAMTFQSYALYPHMTVYDNLAYPLRRRKMPKDEIDQRVKRAADLLRITELLDKRPGLCSGGERQRVALGRTLVRQPKLYLFDEPLTNLDAKLRVHMRVELKKIQKEIGQTAIFASPDEVEATTMADKIAILKDGKLLQYGTFRNIYDHPATQYVATFVGSPPMNTIDCSLEENNAKTYLNAGTFKIDVTENRSLIKSEATSTELLIGIRPSDIGVKNAPRTEEDFEGTIFIKEPMGVDTILDIRVGDMIFKAKVPLTAPFVLDQKVWVNFVKDRMHVIDKKTGRVIY